MRYGAVIGSVCLALGCVGGDAFADTSGFETVIVTAERRPERALDVPLSVSYLSGDAIRDARVRNALDLQDYAPSLTVVGNLGSSDDAVFSIRGQNQPFGGADPGVQTYFAEVPFNAGGAGNYYDLDNVQVLEGPQGTLFGRNTTGGAVLFEPKRPTDKYEADLDVSGGDFQYGQAQGAVNLPLLGDKLALRIAGDIERRDGYTDDVSFGVRTDNVDNESFRAGLEFRPMEGFDNYLVFDAKWDRTHGTGDELTGITTNPARLAAFQQIAIDAFCSVGDPNCVADGTAAFQQYYGGLQFALATQQALGPRATTSTIMPGFRRDDWGVTDIAEWDFAPHMRLRNIFGYRSDQLQPSYDYDGSFIPSLEIVNGRTWQSNSRQLTDELHFTGESEDNVWRWILGYYYESDYPGGYSEIERQAFGGYVNAPLGSTVFQSLNNGGTSNAVFGQATYDASAWIRGLSFTAGGRFTWDRKVAQESDCEITPPLLPSCPFPIPATAPFAQPTQIAHFSAPTGTLAADYKLDDATALYATLRRGYKSGGFNSGALGAPPFKPEYLTDVEVGVKHAGTLMGMPASVDADVYHGWYQDVQKNDFAFVGFIPVVETFNAAKAQIQGVELSGKIAPADWLDLSAFYSYTDAHYDQFVTPFTGNHAGDPFAYTPANKFGLSGRVTLPVGHALGSVDYRASVYTQSRVWFSDFSDLEPDSSQAGYTLVNMAVDWNGVMGSDVDMTFFADNVFNTLYKVGANPLEHLTLTTSSMYGPPRMIGIELRYQMGGR